MGAKTQNLNQKLSKSYNHTPHNMEMYRQFGGGGGYHRRYLIFMGAITEKLVVIFSKILNHILINMGMCKFFLNMLPKCKISPRVQLHNFSWAQKLKTLIRNYPNLTITLPTIWRCTGNLFKISLKFKLAATNQLHNLL